MPASDYVSTFRGDRVGHDLVALFGSDYVSTFPGQRSRDGVRDIDRLAVHYTGEPFRTRDRRRFSAWLELEAWHAWDGSEAWPTPS